MRYDPIIAFKLFDPLIHLSILIMVPGSDEYFYTIIEWWEHSAIMRTNFVLLLGTCVALKAYPDKF